MQENGIRDMDGKVVLITGASSGIGMEAALLYLKNGYKVYGAARRVERMKDIVKSGGYAIALDITKEEECVNCVEQVISREGRIDILVNAAGYGIYGSVEDTSMEEARKQYDVNVFGLAKMTKLVLPYMRKSGGGYIINISSMGGRFTIPYGAWYHSSKYFVESFSDALRMETSHMNIKVVLIEPGLIQTDWGIIAADNLRRITKEKAYAENAGRIADYFHHAYSGNHLTPPIKIAQKIVDISEKKNPKPRYLLGKSAKLNVVIKNVFSDRMFQRILYKVLGLRK